MCAMLFLCNFCCHLKIIYKTCFSLSFFFNMTIDIINLFIHFFICLYFHSAPGLIAFLSNDFLSYFKIIAAREKSLIPEKPLGGT